MVQRSLADRLQAIDTAALLMRVGGVTLFLELVFFEGSFGYVESPGVTGLLEDVLRGGLLLLAVVCLGSGVYLHRRRSA